MSKVLEDAQIQSTISKEGLAYALPGAWMSLISEGNLSYYRHTEFMEEKLLALFRGDINRLIITLPSQYGKSEYVSRSFTSWYLGRRPNDRIIFTSYDTDYASDWGAKSRDALEYYGPIVFGVGVDPDNHSKKTWRTHDTSGANKNYIGGMQSLGVGAGLAGKPAELLIVDDYIKNTAQAMSPTERAKAVEWWRGDVQGRITPHTKVIVVATRWADDDLIGYLLDEEKKGGEHWENCVLSEIAEEGDILGRAVGEPLWPEQRPLEWCLDKKIQMAEHWWQANRQGKPTRKGGNIIKSAWFRRFRERPRREDVEEVVISIDTATKKEEINDYTVIGIWYIIEGTKYYLIDLMRERMDHPELLRTVKDLADTWRPNNIVIENKGSGISLSQHLEQETKHSTTLIEPKGDKEMRMINESNVIKTGHVYIPEEGSQPWLYEYEREMGAFPASGYKDQVDMTSQFLYWAREKRQSIEVW